MTNADLVVSKMLNDSSILQNQTTILKPSQVHMTALRVKIKPGGGDKKAN